MCFYEIMNLRDLLDDYWYEDVGNYDSFKVKETEDGKSKFYELHLPVIGISKENIDISFYDKKLEIKYTIGDKNDVLGRRKEEIKKSYIMEKADSKQIESTLENGVLSIKAPFKKEFNDKQIIKIK